MSPKEWKNSCSTYHSFNMLFVIRVYNFLTLRYIAITTKHLSSSLTESMSMKFQGSDKSRFGDSEKDRYFLSIPKREDKFIPEEKRGELVSCFLNDTAKTCSYGL